MWEERRCDDSIAELIRHGDGVLLFVHADKIEAPSWIVDWATLYSQVGLPAPRENEVEWHPRLCPTQVQLVDLLQLFYAPPLNMQEGRIAIILSAWDKVESERRSPEEFLRERMPLLDQFLSTNLGKGNCRIYGVSAFGGDPDTQADEMLTHDRPSERIKVVGGEAGSYDLTGPISWLSV